MVGNSSIRRNLLAVISGTAAGQLITFLFSPLITRIYSPEAFGVQGVFLSIISVATPVVALRFPMAIVLAKTDREIQSLRKLSIMVASTFSLTTALFLIPFRDEIARCLGVYSQSNLLFLLPVVFMLITMQDLADYHLAKVEKFAIAARVSVFDSLITNGARVISGLISPIALNLAMITSLAPGIRAVLVNAGLKRSGAAIIRNQESTISRDELKNTAQRYSSFPKFRMPTDLTSAASQVLPVLILSSVFSPAIAGFYTLARTVLNVPVNIVSSSTGNVFYSKFAAISREYRPLFSASVKSTLSLLALSSALLIPVSFAFPSLFASVFGDEWRIAGEYARWMSLWLVVAIANVPSVRIAPVINRQGALFAFTFTNLIIRVASIVTAYLVTKDPLIVVAAFSIASCLGNLLIIIGMHCLVRKFDQKTLISQKVSGT